MGRHHKYLYPTCLRIYLHTLHQIKTTCILYNLPAKFGSYMCDVPLKLMEVLLPGRVNEVDDQRCYTQDEHQHYLK